jgi:phosphate-selective porin
VSGHGVEHQVLDIATNTIEEKNLNGGYLQAMYKIDNFKFFDTNGTLIPFVRWQYFDGYNKAESNAARNRVNDWEVGAEWQIAPEVELVAYYHRMKRSNLVTGIQTAEFPNRADYEVFDADALRVQLQYNF